MTEPKQITPSDLRAAVASYASVFENTPKPYLEAFDAIAHERDEARAEIERLTQRIVILNEMVAGQDADLVKLRADAQQPSDPVAAVIRDVCELDPADPKEPSTLCVSVDDLSLIVTRHIATPQPAPAASGAYAAQLDIENHRLRMALRKVMARLVPLLDEDQFGNIESIAHAVGVEPAPAVALTDETESAAFESAMRDTYEMVDVLNPPPAGTYARGSHEGMIAALKTIRANFARAILAAQPAKD